MRIKVKFRTVAILIIVVIVAVGYWILLPRSPYRVDCGKSTDSYDILFVYIQTCPHCHADLIRIKELNLSDKIYMIDAGNTKCEEIINAYSDYIIYHKNSNFEGAPPGIYTPTKVCLYNNRTYIGEMSKSELRDFFENCIRVKG